MTQTSRINPFASADKDRRAIWEALVERDIHAFLAQDWSLVASDFEEEGFVGHSGPANPDEWHISYPSLDSYRNAWLEQAHDFAKLRLRHKNKEEFLFAATKLTRIEIVEDQALAHKKFDGRAEAVNAPDVVLKWQSLYRFRRRNGQWRLTGFLGYLPNPMPGQTVSTQNHGQIYLPSSAPQHKAPGPYSPVLRVKTSEWVILSGQGPITEDGDVSGRTFEEQVHLTVQNCIRQLESADATLADVFRVTVYLDNLDHWSAFNDIYRAYFTPPYPTRTTVQAVLWGGIQIEIDMMAVAR